MSENRESCYWFVENTDKGDVMKAMCIACHEKEHHGWFWNGKEAGYGDYDLQCSICGKVIYQRESENAE